VAATVALAQNDIKRVLAYSTVSQLGLMFLAVGLGAYVAAVFHVITHAFFKALLFLGAGSVIHGMGDEQDMRRMGGLAKWMPVTHGTFLIGWLALSGIPPLSGFWSKDEILVFDYQFSLPLFAVGLAVALLTAFYATRQYALVFWTSPRWGSHAGDAPASVLPAVDPDVEAEEVEGKADAYDADPELERADAGHGAAATDPDFHPHESSWLMTAPLVVLATLAVVGGLINLPFSKELHFLDDWLVGSSGWQSVPFQEELTVGGTTKVLVALVSAAVAVLGAVAAWVLFQRRRTSADDLQPEVLREAWFIDWSYARFTDGPGRWLFDAAAWFDRTVIDGAVNGAGWLVRGAGGSLRTAQNGLVRSYALIMAISGFLLVAWVLVRMTF
jgi:NADH-quinone oxidoreductase subunit L